MSDFPTFTFTFKNGDWNCPRCGQALSAIDRRWGKGWELGIPADCADTDRCASEMLALLKPSQGIA